MRQQQKMHLVSEAALLHDLWGRTLKNTFSPSYDAAREEIFFFYVSDSADDSHLTRLIFCSCWNPFASFHSLGLLFRGSANILLSCF
jgi:hypothetical protein